MPSDFLRKLKIFSPGRLINIFVAVFLISMFFLAIFSAKDDSLTIDEVAYIPAGYSYLTQQDFRLDFEHPPLVKDLVAIPLLFLNLNFPEDHPSWINGVNQQWWFGSVFLYQIGNDVDKVIFWARLPMILLLIFLGWFVFRWTTELAGKKIGLLALFLFCFSPMFLGYGRLVILDVAAALGAVLAIYFYLRFLKEPTIKNVVGAGLSLGIGLLLKFSLVLLIPFFALITFVYLWLKRTDINGIFRYLKLAVLTGLISISLIWAIYQLHLLNYPLERQLEDTRAYLSSEGLNFVEKICLWLITNPFLRPFGHYLFGFLLSFSFLGGKLYQFVYFLGEISNQGWWYYFPVVYFLKTPLAFHILTLIGLGVLFRWLKRKLLKEEEEEGQGFSELILKHFDEFSMGLFIIIYWLISIKSRFNIGIRHILPALPFMFILVSLGIKRWLSGISGSLRKKIAIFTIFFCLGWYAFSSLSIFPHYLSYFNEFAGGPKNGYKYVADSNLDWGQDLKRLVKWVDSQGVNKIYVDYFGGGDPNYYLGNKGISWRGSSYWNWFGIEQEQEEFPKGNYLAVSATFLQTGWGKPGDFSTIQKQDYQWLNDYRPIANIGSSIFIYYIY